MIGSSTPWSFMVSKLTSIKFVARHTLSTRSLACTSAPSFSLHSTWSAGSISRDSAERMQECVISNVMYAIPKTGVLLSSSSVIAYLPFPSYTSQVEKWATGAYVRVLFVPQQSMNPGALHQIHLHRSILGCNPTSHLQSPLPPHYQQGQVS